MNNFFIPNPSKETLKCLSEARIEFCNFDIEGEEGVLIAEDEKNSILEFAEIKEETLSEIEGVVKINLCLKTIKKKEQEKELLKNFSVTTTKWDGGNKEEFIELVEEILAPIVGDVVISVPHGRSVEVVDDEIFRVFIWSGLKGQYKEKDPPAKLWGVKVDCDDSGFVFSGLGVNIVDRSSGWSVAELVGNNLFIHHDACHYGKKSEIIIFRHILEEVVLKLTKTSGLKAMRAEILLQKWQGKAKQQYVSECIKRLQHRLKALEEEIKSEHKDVARIKKNLINNIRSVQEKESTLKRLMPLKDKETDSYEREYESLVSLPGVEGVQVYDGTIRIFTEHIYITPEDHPNTYDIGKFVMEIYTTGDFGAIKFFNMTRKGDGDGSGYNIHHPHVDSDGSPCLGNIDETICELIAEYEYSAIVQLGLQYLKTVNVNDSAGKNIFSKWPKKGEG